MRVDNISHFLVFWWKKSLVVIELFTSSRLHFVDPKIIEKMPPKKWVRFPKEINLRGHSDYSRSGSTCVPISTIWQ